MIARKIGRGYRKRRDAVPSESRLAVKNCLDVMGEVKMKLCSYSNAVIPSKVDIRLKARNPERISG